MQTSVPEWFADTASGQHTAVVVAAHPDDEVISAGGCLLKLRRAVVYHVTDGAPRDLRDANALGFETRTAYVQARRQESLAALRLAGIAPEQLRGAAWVDQEASLVMASIARELALLLEEERLDMVLTHPYEGGHPDHDAAAFVVQAACGILRDRGAQVPARVEMASYHAADGSFRAQEFLPADGAQTWTVVLSQTERDIKCRMIDCFDTQRETLRAFQSVIERYRVAPVYDFTRPPHAGKLHYERFDWGWTGERWRALAAAALQSLQGAGR